MLTPTQIDEGRAKAGLSPRGITGTTAPTDANAWINDFNQKVTPTVAPLAPKPVGYLSRVWKDYQTAGQNIITAIEGGADLMQKGGVINWLRGAGQAGLGAAGQVAGATFAPISEAVKGLIPGEGAGSKIAQAATAGGALAGPVGVIGGTIWGTGMVALDAAKNAIYSHPKVSAFMAQNPDVQTDIDNSINIAMFALATKASKELAPGQEPGILQTPIQEVPGRIAGNILNVAKVPIGWAGKGIEAMKAQAEKLSQLGKVEQTPEQLAAKIAQTGEPYKIKQVTRALEAVEAEGVESYKDLSGAFKKGIKANLEEVDTRLGTSEDLYGPGDIVKQTTTPEGEIISTDFVNKALDHLSKVYEKTADPEGQSRISELQYKYENEGITPKEINDIAKEYGAVVGSRAFTKLGEPKITDVANEYENVRTGVKETARILMPDENTRVLDKLTSDMIEAQRLVDKMSVKVQTAVNKYQEAGLTQKLGWKVGQAADFITGGLLRGAIKYIKGSALEEGRALDPIELQDNLQSNLEDFKGLVKTMSPADAAKALDRIIPPTTTEGIPPKEITPTQPQNYKSLDTIYKESIINSEKEYKNYDPSVLGGKLKPDLYDARMGDITRKLELYGHANLVDNFTKLMDSQKFTNWNDFKAGVKEALNVQGFSQGEIPPTTGEEMITVYHGTEKMNAEIIDKQGLIKPPSKGEPIYLTTSKEVAQEYTGSDGKVYEFQIPKSQLKESNLGKFDYTYKGTELPIQTKGGMKVAK